jgi:serine/threonine protein kinase
MQLDLEEIIETFCAELRRGVTPDIETFAKRYPAYEEELCRLLPMLLTMDAFAQEETGLPQEIELPLPMMLGTEFKLEREIGQGGMGAVFDAVQVPLARRCAVKLLARHLAADTRHREAFIREARVMASLHHPNIVKVFSAGETDEYAYYAMEFIHGQTLEHCPPSGPMQLADYALQAAQALAYAHQCGVTHCDIKPANLLVDHAGRLLISDFGLARLVGKPSTELDSQISGGTRAYMAPECCNTQSFTPLSDQYAFGVTFQLLAKRLETPLPPDLEAIFAVCTAAEPTHRYHDLNNVITDLRHFLAGEPVSVRPATRWRKVCLWAHRHPMATASAALLAVGLPLFTGLLAYSHQQTRHALAVAEHNLMVADTTLACTFEHIGRNDPSREAAILLEVLMPYYQEILHRRNAPVERLAEAEAVIATVALRTGDYATAIDAFRRQNEVAPSFKTTNQLAEALLLAGNREEAIAHYKAIATQTNETTFEDRLERLRAQCALYTLLQTEPDTDVLATLEALSQADPEHADVQHLYLTALAQKPSHDLYTLERDQVLLAERHPESPQYGIIALRTMTARLEAKTPLSEKEEALLRATRKIAQRLLGKWPDDPQILLASVQFSVADRKYKHHDPRLAMQANRAAERLSGALEVLFFGSSLPEDTRDPLFQNLFTSLLESRQQIERHQAARFRRRINEQLSPPRGTRARRFPQSQKPFIQTTP